MSSKVYIQIVGSSTLKVKKLNLESNLSDIRKELEEKNIDMNLLLFADKLGHEFVEIDRKDEDDMLLGDIIFDNSGKHFLYLKDSSPIWNYFNNKYKLDYGRIENSDEIKVAKNGAFKLKNCEFNLIGSEGYKKGRLEFGPKVELIKEKNFLFGADINVQNFIGLGLSIGKSKNESSKDEINSTCTYTDIAKASLKFSKENLELTSDFKNDVKNAIKSKDQYEFCEIIEKYGQFIPTEVILGGKVYFRNVKSTTENSVNKSKNGSANLSIGPLNAKMEGNSGDLKGKTDFYSFELMGIIGGSPPIEEEFDEKAWNKSLEDYQTWDCIEFKNFINIFQLLPNDIYKEALESIGKKILRTIVKDYDYCLDNPERYQIVKLMDIPDEDLKIILNKDADCDIFATVVDDDETSKKVFFNCQILKNPNAKPCIIIHGIQKELKEFQKEFQKRICKLKIGIMVIGYDVDFSFIHSNISVELINNTYSFKDELIANNFFLGIPVLDNFNHLNYSITIGYNFRKLNNEFIIEPFSYCSESNSYHFSDLPKFTFYTIVIKNYSSIYGSHTLEYPKIDEIKFSDKNPKYISMYFSEANSYLPVFVNQKSEKVYLKHICNKSKCKKCTQELKYKIRLNMYSLI
ncbi:hypothetical protein RclHR1_09420002 [Rhizophagus clarus]|uniref:Uncharacterized protein n=1 Tax=Rhizophagus clarus TaxID=94130 RepID=A0A2Z6S4D5_9GLOM|nr:hypothetical protein RclHR1_09420002 [Rhizophagus clarus]GES80268.1 hypothetical protein GLOIN_2v1497522 [Rhizophagus clarus]